MGFRVGGGLGDYECAMACLANSRVVRDIREPIGVVQLVQVFGDDGYWVS